MAYLKILIYALATFMATSTLVFADDDDDDDGDIEIPFAEAFLYFELNDTDGDLGIHGKIDGDAWKVMEIEDPWERTLLKVKARGRLKRQGMTELFFESAEPCFPTDDECDDPLDPDDFFARFPEGEYEIEGETLEGDELENEVWLSHIIPAAPVVEVNDVASASREVCGCDVEDLDEGEVCEALPTAFHPVTLSWAAVDSSHALKHAPDGLGEDGLIEVRYYEVVVEIDETDFKSTSIVPPNVLSWEIPGAFLLLSDRIKYEVLVRTNVIGEDGTVVMGEIDGEPGPLPGNVSALESCFEVIPPPV